MEIALIITLVVLSIAGAACMTTSFGIVCASGGWNEVMTKPRREGRWNLALVLMITGASIGTLLFTAILVASQFVRK